jgi:hypothetical protein
MSERQEELCELNYKIEDTRRTWYIKELLLATRRVFEHRQTWSKSVKVFSMTSRSWVTCVCGCYFIISVRTGAMTWGFVLNVSGNVIWVLNLWEETSECISKYMSFIWYWFHRPIRHEGAFWWFLSYRGECSMYKVICLRLPLLPSVRRSWLQTQRSRTRFPSPPDFLKCRASGTGSTQPIEDK